MNGLGGWSMRREFELNGSTEVPKIIINTTMSKEDYKKFLYIATFKRNKFTIPILLLMAMIGGLFIAYGNGYFSIIIFVISWILLFVFSIMIILFQIQRKNAKRVKTDKTGAFDSVNTLKFYNDKIVMENQSVKSTGELAYEKFYTLMESKDYFIFYFTANQASLIRKKDIDDIREFREFILDKFEGRYKQI